MIPIYTLLIISIILYLSHPQDQFQKIAYGIDCPANVLHETPFSFSPMMIYRPDCNHYIGTSSDWESVTHETLYTTEDKVNNYNVSYDIYIHYFNELKVPELLNNSNMTTIELIRIES